MFQDKKLKEIISKIEFAQKKKDDDLYNERLTELDKIHTKTIKEILQQHKKDIQKTVESNEAEAKERTKKYVKKVEDLLDIIIRRQQDYIENVETQNKKLKEAIEILRPLHGQIDDTLRRLKSYEVLINNASLEMKQNIERTTYELEIKTFAYNKQAKRIAELLGEVQDMDGKQKDLNL